MALRKVTITVGGRPCTFLSDDPEEYVSALEQKANAVMRKTGSFSGSSYSNAILSVVSLTDELLQTEKKIQELSEEANPEPAEKKQAGVRKKSPPKLRESDGQVSVWDVLKMN